MLLETLARHVAERGDEVAVITPRTRLTYRELGESVSYSAERLTAAGIGPDDVVGMTLPGELDHFIMTLALLRTGCVQVALPSHEPRAVREETARRVNCTAVVTSADGLDAAPSVAPEHGRAPVRDLPGPYPADRINLLIVSSGTTGRSKIAPLSQAQIGLQGLSWQWPPTRDVYLRPTPIEFNNSRRQRLYNIVNATTNVFLDGSATDWFEMCRAHGVTRLAVSAMQASRVLDRTRRDGCRLPADCHVRIGGSDMPAPARRDFIDAVTPLLHVTYATSEFGSIATAGPEINRDRPDSVGTAHGDVDIEIVDDDDRRVVAGTAGRIRVRSRGMATRYLDDEAASRRAYNDGWFYPGDVGTLDAAGVLSVSGRGDDMMNLASINIFPSEIENVVSEHADVVACAAFALKSRDLGDIPMVAVVPRPGTDARQIAAFARRRLGVRAPRKVFLVDELPRISSGKIDRTALRERFRAGNRTPALDAGPEEES